MRTKLRRGTDPVQPRIVVCAGNDVYVLTQQKAGGDYMETARCTLGGEDKATATSKVGAA